MTLEQKLTKLVLWTKDNKDQFIIILAVCLFFLLAIPLYFQYKNNQYDENLNKYSIIEGNFYRGNYQEVISKSDELLKSNLKKDTQKLILFYRALAFYNMNKPDEAIKIYDELIAKYPKDYLLANFYDGKAYVFEMQKKYKEAIDVWYKIINEVIDSYLVPNAYKSIARNYELLNEFAEAEKIYKMINTMFSGSSWADFANKRLEILKMKNKSK